MLMNGKLSRPETRIFIAVYRSLCSACIPYSFSFNSNISPLGESTEYALKVCHKVKHAFDENMHYDVIYASYWARFCHLRLPCFILHCCTYMSYVECIRRILSSCEDNTEVFWLLQFSLFQSRSAKSWPPWCTTFSGARPCFSFAPALFTLTSVSTRSTHTAWRTTRNSSQHWRSRWQVAILCYLILQFLLGFYYQDQTKYNLIWNVVYPFMMKLKINIIVSPDYYWCGLLSSVRAKYCRSCSWKMVSSPKNVLEFYIQLFVWTLVATSVVQIT